MQAVSTHGSRYGGRATYAYRLVAHQMGTRPHLAVHVEQLVPRHLVHAVAQAADRQVERPGYSAILHSSDRTQHAEQSWTTPRLTGMQRVSSKTYRQAFGQSSAGKAGKGLGRRGPVWDQSGAAHALAAHCDANTACLFGFKVILSATELAALTQHKWRVEQHLPGQALQARAHQEAPCRLLWRLPASPCPPGDSRAKPGKKGAQAPPGSA